MIAKTLLLGEQYYNWIVQDKQPFDYQELKIWGAEGNQKELIVDVLDKNNITPNQVHQMIEYALSNNWATRWRWQPNQAPIQVVHSLAEEHDLTIAVSKRMQKRVAGIDRVVQKTQINTLESYLELSLPTLFKQLYLYVADGDFGPDYGFFPLLEDTKERLSIWSVYQDVKDSGMQEYDWEWSNSLVPFLHWGTNIYSCIDCQSLEGSIWVLDTNLKETRRHWKECVWKHTDSLYEWLLIWLKANDYGRALWLDMYRKKGLIG